MYARYKHLPAIPTGNVDIVTHNKAEREDKTPPHITTSSYASRKSIFARQKLVTIFGLLISAAILSVAHHFYYSYLNNQLAGSTNRQQWSTRIGTGLATTVVILLRGAVSIAYIQLLWLALRKRAFRISDIDALFALSSGDVTALFKKGIWTTTAMMAVPVSVLFIILPIAAIFPPATLSVMLEQRDIANELSVPQPDWSSMNWMCGGMTGCASEPVRRIATQASQNGEVLPLYQPTANSSYQLFFEGPSLSCQPANVTQQAVFDYYTNRTVVEHYSRFSDDNSTSNHNSSNDGFYRYWSAFLAPNFKDSRGDYDIDNSAVADVWLPELGPAYWNTSGTEIPGEYIPRTDIKTWWTDQLWVQTFDQNLVCTLIVANFNVTVIHEQGLSTLVYDNIEFTRMYSTIYGNDPSNDVFHAFAAALIGNITFDPHPFVQEYTSNVPSSNLAACPELNWTSVLHKVPYPPPQLPSIETPPSWEVWAREILEAFPSQPSDCRNQSLSRALEDLMNNVTVSMLSSPYLTSELPTIVNISESSVVYVYSPRELILSYATALGISFLAVAAGLSAARSNGIIHVLTFSSFVATTRNSELDRIFDNEKGAACTLSKDLAEQKLKFGNLKLSSLQYNRVRASKQAPDKETKMAFGTVA